jgi:hypothetical protein
MHNLQAEKVLNCVKILDYQTGVPYQAYGFVYKCIETEIEMYKDRDRNGRDVCIYLIDILYTLDSASL